MPLITLSTDFGWDDPYVGIMKGVILGINRGVRLVDLTHTFSHHQLLEAAFILNTAYPYFPFGTIHLTVVDPGVGGERRLIAVQGEDSVWVGPDNGLFTLVLKNRPEAETVLLTNTNFFRKTVSSTFHGRDILAPVAAHLSLGIPLATMGPKITDPVLLPGLDPKVNKNKIIGGVLWADNFGNLITNISQKTLSPFLSGSSLNIIIGSHNTMTEIHQTYSQGPPDGFMALLGSSGYLEIASNLGNAAEKVGFQSGVEVKGRVINN